MDKAESTSFNLQKHYNILLETGVIAALLIFIVAMNVDMPSKQRKVNFNNEQEVVHMQEIPKTVQPKEPAAPADPVVLAKPPIDEPVTDNPDIVDPLSTSDALNQIEMPPKNDQQDDSGESIFMAVEHMPKLIGGKENLYKELNYPKSCSRASIEGRVVLSFIVNKDGSIEDVNVTGGIGGGCDEAAIKALKKMQFEPGLQRGNPVRVRYSWPIVFKLQ